MANDSLLLLQPASSRMSTMTTAKTLNINQDKVNHTDPPTGKSPHVSVPRHIPPPGAGQGTALSHNRSSSSSPTHTLTYIPLGSTTGSLLQARSNRLPRPRSSSPLPHRPRPRL